MFLLLTVGDEKGTGLFLMHGEEAFMKENGQNLSELLQGRGVVKGRIMHGKAANLKGLKEAVKQFEALLPQL